MPYVTEQLVLGGVDLIQLRAKKLPLEQIAELGQNDARRHSVRGPGPLFILNDHPELVPEIGADGIHVGQDDLSVAEARAQAGSGASSSANRPTASTRPSRRKRKARITSASARSTPRRPSPITSPVGPALIGQVRAAVRVPQFCIGGINEKTLPEVIAAGARRVVIVSALLQSADIPAYCRRVRAAFESGATSAILGHERLVGALWS